MTKEAPEAAAAARTAARALEPLRARFKGQLAFIFASGPSLTQIWSPERRPEWPSIAVNDAWRIVPDADILYATDSRWWRYHKLCQTFKGVKVGANDRTPCDGIVNLEFSGQAGFDPRLGWLRHGSSSGYAAAHLAAQLGAWTIVLVGFDCRPVDGKTHFFGEHPAGLGAHRKNPYSEWVELYAGLAAALAERGIELLNATPGSALTLPTVDLDSICPTRSA